ncbi:MAG: peptide ABC transporter substrate-binding protein [Anaerolineales bacterium]|nr:peptide ABC transporter substrate-binding protein [Anaerolineales bacterium]
MLLSQLKRLQFGFLVLALSACTAQPQPDLPTLAPTVNLANGTPSGATTPASTSDAVATATRVSEATPSPTPIPVTLTICQQAEPLSLYIYANDGAARTGIFEALYDGPLDTNGFALQPVILEELPTVSNGRLVLTEVSVQPDEIVVDAVDLQLKSLADGVRLAQIDGSVVTYTAGAPARTVQVSAQFKIKPGIVWSDNTQLTADDSRFSYEAARYFDTQASKFITDRTESYEVVDTLTVEWTGLRGFRDTDAARHFWSPLPRHLFNGVNPSDLKNNQEANDRPVGWGPFVLQDWQKGERLTLTRNPNYFRSGEGLPQVGQVVFRFGLTPEQILAEVETGGCDIGSQATDFTALTPQILELQTAGKLAAQFTPSTVFEHLDFGLLPVEEYRRAAGNEVFMDIRVRQGLAQCVNRQELINQLLSGVGEVPASYVPRPHPLFNPQVTLYQFDGRRGQQLLSEAGWNDADGDGVRDKDGRRLVLDYVTGPEGSAFRQQLATLLTAQLKVCGVEVRVRWLATTQELYEVWPAGPIFGRQFDVSIFPWRAGAEPPCELYLTEAIPNDLNPAGSNNTGFSNAAFDAACQRGLRSFNEAERRNAHLDAQAIWARELPSLPLFFRFQVGVARPAVSGYQPSTTARSDLWNIEALEVTDK